MERKIRKTPAQSHLFAKDLLPVPLALYLTALPSVCLGITEG
jgi:hypothetical protein